MRARGLATFAVAAVFVSACGDDDFENAERAPVPLELTGVIQPDKVTVSPAKAIGAGPFVITISNQIDDPHTVKLEGESIVAEAGPVAPLDTVTIRKTLEPGSYEVQAGSEQAQTKEIEPAVLEIGAARKDSNSDLLLP